MMKMIHQTMNFWFHGGELHWSRWVRSWSYLIVKLQQQLRYMTKIESTFGIVKSGFDSEVLKHFLQDDIGNNLGFEKKTFNNQGMHRTKWAVLHNMDNSLSL